MRVKISATIFLLILVFLTGCSERIVYKDKLITPPESLLVTTEVVSAKEYGVKTHGDVIEYTFYLKGQVGLCNTDKQSIIDYINQHKQEDK